MVDMFLDSRRQQMGKRTDTTTTEAFVWKWINQTAWYLQFSLVFHVLYSSLSCMQSFQLYGPSLEIDMYMRHAHKLSLYDAAFPPSMSRQNKPTS
jgi:hypothetical protein